MSNPISWQTNDLSRERCESILGKDHVLMIEKMATPSIYCEGRAMGMWDANEKEYHAAYQSLRIIFSAKCDC